MTQINPESTTEIEVPCVCLLDSGGLAHDTDSVTVRDQFGYGDLIDIQTKGMRWVQVETDAGPQVQPVLHPGGEHFALLEISVKAWTLVQPDGSPLPITSQSIRLLPEDTGSLIAVRVSELYESSKKGRTLPNPSGGRSQPSSPESSAASPNRAQRRAAKRSTSKS